MKISPVKYILCFVATGGTSIADIEEDELEDEVKPKSYQTADVERPPEKSKKVQITIPALPQVKSN